MVHDLHDGGSVYPSHPRAFLRLHLLICRQLLLNCIYTAGDTGHLHQRARMESQTDKNFENHMEAHCIGFDRG